MTNTDFNLLDPRRQTEKDLLYAERMEGYFGKSLGKNIDKLRNFPKFVPRQILAKFLSKCEIFQRVLPLHGHIIECGVHLGGGLMTYAQLSAIYEPVNYLRQIVGFDTFTGFPDLGPRDMGDNMHQAVKGGLAAHAEADIQECIELYDLIRPLGHLGRVQLVAGDAVKTIPEYVEKNKHLVVAMLILDFDLFEPTKVALENFLPRMPKGSVLVFDELCDPAWPGETMAVLETLGIRNLRIERFPYTSQPSFAVLE